MRKRIVYIGNFSPSKMDAQTQLILGNSKILRELNYDVTMICNDGNMIPQNEVCGHDELEGFGYYALRFSKNVNGLIKSTQMFRQLESILNEINPDSISHVICYGSIGFGNQLLMLSRWCKKRNISIIANCVDLPDVNHGNLLERIVKKIDRYIRNYASAQMDGLIAVSDYIKHYFMRRSNYPVVVIPPLKDTEEIKGLVFAPREKTKKIAYVGVPFPIDGRKVDESAYKDRIDLFIDLLCKVPCKDWRLDIYGMTQEQYERVVTRQSDMLRKHQSQIVFHGRVNHNEALHAVADADYSVVYRLKNRMTMAGFSTKFVESISCGTPVLMTDTSEYVKYAEKGIPCVMFDLENEEQRIEALENALRKSPEEIMVMKRKCRDSHVFDYRHYIQLMRDFLEHVSAGVKRS